MWTPALLLFASLCFSFLDFLAASVTLKSPVLDCCLRPFWGSSRKLTSTDALASLTPALCPGGEAWLPFRGEGVSESSRTEQNSQNAPFVCPENSRKVFKQASAATPRQSSRDSGRSRWRLQPQKKRRQSRRAFSFVSSLHAPRTRKERNGRMGEYTRWRKNRRGAAAAEEKGQESGIWSREVCSNLHFSFLSFLDRPRCSPPFSARLSSPSLSSNESFRYHHAGVHTPKQLAAFASGAWLVSREPTRRFQWRRGLHNLPFLLTSPTGNPGPQTACRLSESTAVPPRLSRAALVTVGQIRRGGLPDMAVTEVEFTGSGFHVGETTAHALREKAAYLPSDPTDAGDSKGGTDTVYALSSGGAGHAFSPSAVAVWRVSGPLAHAVMLLLMAKPANSEERKTNDGVASPYPGPQTEQGCAGTSTANKEERDWRRERRDDVFGGKGPQTREPQDHAQSQAERKGQQPTPRFHLPPLPRERVATFCKAWDCFSGAKPVPLDDVILLRFDAPRSATGEDVVEVHSHGSRAALSALLRFFEGVQNAIKSVLAAYGGGRKSKEFFVDNGEDVEMDDRARLLDPGREARGVPSLSASQKVSRDRGNEADAREQTLRASPQSGLEVALRALLLRAICEGKKERKEARDKTETKPTGKEDGEERHPKEDGERTEKTESRRLVSERGIEKRGISQTEHLSRNAEQNEEDEDMRQQADGVRWLSSVGDLRPAEAGEFTLRAFLNGKIESVQQVEALADLLNADTVAQHRLALRRLRRHPRELRDLLERWRKLLQEALAFSEAALEIGDDAQEADAELARACGAQDAEKRVRRLLQELRCQLELGMRDALVQTGVTVVFCGPTNAGKSTLFNSLVGRDTAIVSPIAGTTRDVLTAPIQLSGSKVLLTDTAGLRPARDWQGGASARASAAEAVAGFGAQAARGDTCGGRGRGSEDCVRALDDSLPVYAEKGGDAAPYRRADAVASLDDGDTPAVDCVEREGMARAVRTAQEADVLIFLLECLSSREETLEHARRFLRLFRESFSESRDADLSARPRARRVFVVLNKVDLLFALLENREQGAGSHGDSQGPQNSDAQARAAPASLGVDSLTMARKLAESLPLKLENTASNPSEASTSPSSPSLSSSFSSLVPPSQLSSEGVSDFLEELEKAVREEMPPSLLSFLQPVSACSSSHGASSRVLLLSGKRKWNLSALHALVCRAVQELASPDNFLRSSCVASVASTKEQRNRRNDEKEHATGRAPKDDASERRGEREDREGEDREREEDGEEDGEADEDQVGLLTGKRVLEALKGLERHLTNCLARESEEERTEDLRLALRWFRQRLLGEARPGGNTEAVLDVIFSSFCVGK
uniref:GTPase n=1 Tax=Toxoplasma gondii COUG TaxID=1074873 RepID=A0A2G8XX23_TOXGO|nr:GTPase [Toxoplasma gondii COUG]